MALYKEYDSAVKKSRRNRTIKKLAAAGAVLTVACMATTAFVASPKGEKLIEQMAILDRVDNNVATSTLESLNQHPGNKIATLDVDKNMDIAVEDIDTATRKNQYPGWEYTSKDNIKSAAVAATEYERSSNGLYLPRIQLTCEKHSYDVSFIVDEVLSTEVASIKISSNLAAETEQEWKLAETYRAAYAPNPDMFINLLRAASTLTVTYQTFGGEQAKTSEFDLNGSSKAIGEFRSQCATDSSSGIVGTSLEH